ncbi:MAG: response regulator [Eisenbergiella massiliensis]
MEFRLLIIEDEPDIRLMIEEALSLPGYRITSAEDGQQALQLFSEKEGWDLVVLDLMLPKVDGLTVLRKIREKARCRCSSCRPETGNMKRCWDWNTARMTI